MLVNFAGNTTLKVHRDTENDGPKNAISISKNGKFWGAIFQFRECM